MKLIYKILIGLGVAGLIFGGLAFIPQKFDGLTIQQQINALPQYQKLKVDKSRLWASKEVDDIRCNDKGFECQNFGRMMQYTYVSNVEVPTFKKSDLIPQKFGGLSDVQETSRDYNVVNFREGATTTSIFYQGVSFIKKKATGRWFYSEVATTTIKAFNLQTKLTISEKIMNLFTAYATESTFYPDPNPETNTVDGTTAAGTGADFDWADLRARTGDYSQDSSVSNIAIHFQTTTTSGKWLNMYSGVYLFNTGPTIPAENTISSATLSLMPVSLINEIGTAAQTNMHCVSSAPASNTALANSDFANRGGTNFGYIAYTSLALETYGDITLNASGITNIAKGSGVSKFGVRSGADLNNSEPTWATNKTFSVKVYNAETTGTSQDPKLVVVHSSAAVSVPNNDFIIFE